MKKKIEDLRIIQLSHLQSDFILLSLQSSNKLENIIPGQFVEILIDKSKTTFLRRPYSIYDVDYDNRVLSFLIKVVGQGTKALSQMKAGEYLNTIYPLGNGFSVTYCPNNLFIAGGYGLAPFMCFSKVLSKKNIKPTMIIGARTSSDLVLLDEFSKYADIYCTTDDGSYGHKGLVTEHPLLSDPSVSFDKIYSCGPEPMMKAVANYSKKSNIECEVSLDNLMACGIGACLCCITETVRGNELVCTHGPVFDVNVLKW